MASVTITAAAKPGFLRSVRPAKRRSWFSSSSTSRAGSGRMRRNARRQTGSAKSGNRRRRVGGGLERGEHRLRKAVPARRLGAQLAPALGGQRVELGAAVVLGEAPFGAH